MTAQIDYKQMAMVLLAVSEALHAALKHQGMEADDITFLVEDDKGNSKEQVSTVDAVIDACRHALNMPRHTITTTEHPLGAA